MLSVTHYAYNYTGIANRPAGPFMPNKNKLQHKTLASGYLSIWKIRY